MLVICKRLLFIVVAGVMILGSSGCPKPPSEDKPTRPSTTSLDFGAEAPSATPAAPTGERAAAPEQAQPSEKPGETPPAMAPAAEEKPAEKTEGEKKEAPAESAPASGAGQAAATPEPPQAPPQGTPFEVKVPLGLPPVPIPADNPMTVEKIELGKMLYFDKRVSADGTISCATCHDPKMAWAEHLPTSKGIHEQVGGRNAPTVINAAYATTQFWDGRAKTLEEQAVGPVANPIEMGHTIEGMVQTLDGIPQYQELFKKVFGTGVNAENFAKAVAAFERTILSGNSPYDRYKAGDQNALTDAQKRGLKVFEESGCADCHTAPLFSNYEFYNAGIGMNKEKPDEGRKTVTGKDEDMGAFRVPSLREVANTGPYFHDGSVATLEEAVAIMAKGGIDNPHRSADFDTVREAQITSEQQKDLVEFLKALSGEFPVIEPPQLP